MMSEVHSISAGSRFYPAGLRNIYGELALPELRASGNLDLLLAPSVGFCGSRNASERGLAVATQLASLLADRGIVVTSGYARGVDTQAHLAALEVGGSTIIALPEGIDHFRIKRELARHWAPERTLVLSQYADNAVWRADRAMERNKIIVGISSATVVIEAGATGGTLDAGMTALRYGMPLFVASYIDATESNEGNRLLLAAGAKSLGRNRDTLAPNIDQLINAIGPKSV